MRRPYVCLFIVIVPLIVYLSVVYRLTNASCFLKVSWNHGLPSGMRENSHNISTLMTMYSENYAKIERERSVLLKNIAELLSQNNIVHTSDSVSESTNVLSGNANVLTNKAWKYLFNCNNIHQIKLIRKVGVGVSKQTFLGIYKNFQVAVKMVTRHVKDVHRCRQALEEAGTDNDHARSRCFSFPRMKLMKEILFLEQLQQPSLVQLLGYCVRNEEGESTDLREHGVIAVYEYGERLVLDSLILLPWQLRLQHAIDMAKFLYYFETSPLGSLKISDFKESHFLRVNNTIKMTDLDDINNIEPTCLGPFREKRGDSDSPFVHGSTCQYDVLCTMGQCIGHNAKQNMMTMNQLFFKRLLHGASFPEHIGTILNRLSVALDNLSITALHLVEKLQQIQNSMISNNEDQFQ